jgi:hypothetical protein
VRNVCSKGQSTACPGSDTAASRFTEDKLTSIQQFPLFEKTWLHADAKESWPDCGHTSHFDPKQTPESVQSVQFQTDQFGCSLAT